MNSKKTIILGVTGSVAAYKAPEIVRRFVKIGVQVHPVLTEAAANFVGPRALEAVSCIEIPSHINKSAPGYFRYLELAKNADLILIAPATADFIAHIAHGFASDLLETIVLARACPLVIAPAMNERMWLNEMTQGNVAKLREQGAHLIDPGKGVLACGEEGIGRLANLPQIVKTCQNLL